MNTTLAVLNPKNLYNSKRIRSFPQLALKVAVDNCSPFKGREIWNIEDCRLSDSVPLSFIKMEKFNHASQPSLTQTFLNFSFSDGAASYPRKAAQFFFWIRDQNKQRESVILLQASNVIQQIYNS